MKKSLFLMMVSLMTLGMNAQTVVLDEGFESGAIPSTWSQEYGPRNGSATTASQCPWKVEKGGTKPTGAAQGEYRAYFRNETGQTQGYITRLVLPELHLSSVYEPILRFSYAQTKWRTDIDTLRILYKAKSTDQWRVLQEYTTSQPLWTRMEVRLPGVTNTYRIAFEASDGVGNGIVLDSVQVRSLPQCTTPSNLMVGEVSGNEATLSWNADYDASRFRIIVDDTLEYTTTDDTWSYRLTGLAICEHTASVQALCEGEQSEMSDTLTFLIPFEVALPYSYNFNDCPKSTVAWWPEGWNFGNNAGMNAFVSNHSDNNNERTSPDKSPSLIFAMDNFYIRSIPAGSYQYAVTPALTGAPLNTCRVQFEAGVYEYNGINYAHSIIVGVMTDAKDATSFVPVDTVSVTLYEKFQTCYVDLDKYKGNGRFVAFRSDFNKPNNFYIDNLYIKAHDEKDAPVNVRAIGHTNEVVIKWEGRAKSYGVEIQSTESEYSTIVRGITSTSTTITNVPEWERCQVRVWAEGGDTSTWASCRTSLPYTIPLTYNFNGEPYDITSLVNDFYAPKGVQTFGTNNFRPYCKSSNSGFSVYGRNSTKGFGLTESTTTNLGAHDYWAVYPYMERMDTLQMIFYMSCGNSYNADNSWLSVGVMEDPQDLSTFHEMLQCVGNENWQRYVVDLKDSPMTNGFVAMHWFSPEKTKGSNAWVDDVQFDRRGECDMVKDIRIDSTNMRYNRVKFLYTVPGGVNVNVRVSTDRNLTDAQLAAGSSCAYKRDGATGGSVIATGLKGGTTYYLFMQSACSSSNTGLWTSPMEFTTPCAPLTLPYTDGFEGWETSYRYRPACWNGKDASSSPQVASGGTLAHGGSKYMTLNSYYAGDSVSLVLPAIEDGINKVRVRFYAKPFSNEAQKLYIGVLTNPEDYSTYEQLAVITEKGKEYHLEELLFTNYAGQGKYLSIMTMNNDSVNNSVTWHLDDLTIESLECLTPFGIQLFDITATSISSSWLGTSANGWQVIVADTVIDPKNPAQEHVVANATTTEPYYKATDLQGQKLYYFYYRTLCADAQWADTLVMTQCRPLELGKVYDFEDQTGYASTTNIPASAHIECWTMTMDTNAVSTNSTVPFVYKSKTYAHSGENCIYLMTECGDDHSSWFALPAADVEDMTLLNIRFYANHAYKYNWYDVEVGVMTDPQKASTFKLVDKVRPTTEKLQYRINLENYTGKGKYIAFRTTSCSYPLYVDDIEIIEVPCRNLHPTVANITNNSVLVKSNIKETNSWKIGMTGEGGFSKDTVITTPRQATVHGLPANTLITLRAATICSIEGQDTVFGDWDEISFRTRCNDVLVEETSVEDFEGMKPRLESKDEYYDIPCWQVGNNKSTTQKPYIISKDSKLPTEYLAKNENSFHSGNQCLVIYTSSTSDAAWAAMPQLSENDPVTNVQVTFWARGTDAWSTNKLIVGVTTDLSDWASFEPIDTIYTDVKEYKKFLVRFNGYKGDYLGKMGRYITFVSQFGDDNLIYIDDVELKHISACAEPIGVRAQSVDDEKAEVVWNGTSERYRVLVSSRALDENEWENCTDYIYNDTVTTAKYQLQMPQLGNYFVYVKAVCGEEGAWNVKGVEVSPTCGARLSVPAIEDFEQSKNIPTCWLPIGTTYYNKVEVDTTAYTGNHGLKLHNYFYSTTTATGIVLPLLSEEPGDCKITFFANKGKQSSNTIYAALLAERDSISVDSLAKLSAVCSQTISGSTWQQISFDFSKLEADQVDGKQFIVLFTKTSNYDYDLYLDDIQINKMDVCRAPSKIEAAVMSGTSAQVTLKPYRNYNTEWEIQVMDTTTKTTTTTTTTTKTTTISGLELNHTYAISARTVCDESEKSDWGETVYIHTVVPPTGLKATATDEAVSISWDNQAHGHWNLYISTELILPSEVESRLGDFVVVEKGLTSTSYIFQPAAENTTYYILLQSANMGMGDDTYARTSVTTLKHVYTPSNVQVASVSDTSVTITWQDTISLSNTIEISTDANFSTILTSTVVTDVKTYTYDQLDEQTTYYIRINQVKDTYQSAWVVTSFTTHCGMDDIPFEYGFEDATLPQCWKTISKREGWPKANTTYYVSGKQSWDFYATFDTLCPQAIVLPGLKGDLSECTLQFKARCHNASGTSYGDATMYVALTDNPNKLTVDNITSQYVVASLAIAGKTFTQYEADFTDLDAQTIQNKPFIIMYMNAKGRIYIDDLVVKVSDKCRKPMQLRTVEVGGRTATFTFDQAKPSGTWHYAVCSNAAMTDTVQQGTTSSQTFTVTGLQKTTTYYASVRQICNVDNWSDASDVVSFTTLMAPYYEETFRGTDIPSDWSKASGWVDSICQGGSFTSYSNTWRILTTGIGIPGNHAFYRAYSTWHNDWLISPAIAIDETDSTLLSFDAALTMHDNNLPVADSRGLRFLTLISTDAGKTWQKKDTMRITNWNNTTKRYALDLTEYRGNVVKVAFYVEITTDQIADMDIHLGNVRINWYKCDQTEVSVCEFDDIIFEEEGIVIPGGSYPVGDHDFNTLIPASDPQGGAVKDIIRRLTAHVLASPSTVVRDTIQPGESYSKYGFTNLTTSGTYTRKAVAENGCDSAFILYLTVKSPAGWMPAKQEQDEQNISKVLINNEVFIIRNGQRYDLFGRKREDGLMIGD